MRSAAGLTEAAYPAFDFRAQGDRWSRAGQEPHARFQRSFESGRSWEGGPIHTDYERRPQRDCTPSWPGF